VTAAAALFAPDAAYREARSRPVIGRAAIAAHWELFFTQGPPWRIAVGEIFGDARGERYAIPYVFSMEKDGAWQDRPGCALVRVEAGLIAEWSEYSG
jgi:hypothetical protein